MRKVNIIEYPAKQVSVSIKIGAPKNVVRLINLKNAVEIEGRTRLGNRSLKTAQDVVGGQSRLETLCRLQREIEPHVVVAE